MSSQGAPCSQRIVVVCNSTFVDAIVQIVFFDRQTALGIEPPDSAFRVCSHMVRTVDSRICASDEFGKASVSFLSCREDVKGLQVILGQRLRVS